MKTISLKTALLTTLSILMASSVFADDRVVGASPNQYSSPLTGASLEMEMLTTPGSTSGSPADQYTRMRAAGALSHDVTVLPTPSSSADMMLSDQLPWPDGLTPFWEPAGQTAEVCIGQTNGDNTYTITGPDKQAMSWNGGPQCFSIKSKGRYCVSAPGGTVARQGSCVAIHDDLIECSDEPTIPGAEPKLPANCVDIDSPKAIGKFNVEFKVPKSNLKPAPLNSVIKGIFYIDPATKKAASLRSLLEKTFYNDKWKGVSLSPYLDSLYIRRNPDGQIPRPPSLNKMYLVVDGKAVPLSRIAGKLYTLEDGKKKYILPLLQNLIDVQRPDRKPKPKN